MGVGDGRDIYVCIWQMGLGEKKSNLKLILII